MREHQFKSIKELSVHYDFYVLLTVNKLMLVKNVRSGSYSLIKYIHKDTYDLTLEDEFELDSLRQGEKILMKEFKNVHML